MDTHLQSAVRLLSGRRLAVLTGAGCSTESGIPDYRGPETRKRARNPIRFAQFVSDEGWRQRYWARSFVGWRRVAAAEPNVTHHHLAELERQGIITGLITQNVDGLHRRAGSKRLVALHGRLADVVCLACGTHEPRSQLQTRIRVLNPDWQGVAEGHAPDGDADIQNALYEAFVAPMCLHCRGALKPDVVFFGENVPRERVTQSKQFLADAEALLVLGSSLTVFSGLRFVKYAVADGKPVVIVNLGETRGDALCNVKVSAKLGEVLPELCAGLGAPQVG